jgi:hypothetical protein
MTTDEFAQVTRLMCVSLPCPQQEKRLHALFEFFGHGSQSLVGRAANEAAKTLEHFPTPKAFGELVDRFRPQVRGTESLDAWKPKPPMSDDEFTEKMLAGDPEKMLLGILVMMPEADIPKAPAPVQRIWAFASDLIGPKRLDQIRLRAQRAKHFGFLSSGAIKRPDDHGTDHRGARNEQPQSASDREPVQQKSSNGG